MANKLGLKNDSAIANYEAGYSIPKDKIKLKMCEVFECTLDYLFGRTDLNKTDKLQIQAIVYNIEKLTPKKKKILINILKQMSDEADKTMKN